MKELLLFAAFLTLAFFCWALVHTGCSGEDDDKEQEEYLKKWLENHGK